MSDDRFAELERFSPLFDVPEPSFEAFLRRRDRRYRNQRIAAGVAGVAFFVATVTIVVGLSWTSRAPTPADEPPRVGQETPTASATPSFLRADARVTFDGSACTLDDVAVQADTLRLELVNTSGAIAQIRIGRVVGSGVWPGVDADRHLEEIRLSTLRSSEPRLVVRRAAAGRWGVICYGDGLPSPSAWAPKEVDTAGPLEVIPLPQPDPTESADPPQPHADGMVVFDGSTCTVEGISAPVHTNTLRLKLVNTSDEASIIRIGRIRRAEAWPAGDADRHFHEVAADLLFAKRELMVSKHAPGRWGVICYTDGEPSPNGFSPKEVDTAGPFIVKAPTS